MRYTVAWSGVNWADLMAAQDAFRTDFYDRSTRTIIGTMLWTEYRPVIKIGPKGVLGSHEIRPVHSAPSLGQSICILYWFLISNLTVYCCFRMKWSWCLRKMAPLSEAELDRAAASGVPVHGHQNSRDSGQFTNTKGLLNGPGQNNCFLNSAVQVRTFLYSVRGLERSELGGSHGWPGRLWDRFLWHSFMLNLIL